MSNIIPFPSPRSTGTTTGDLAAASEALPGHSVAMLGQGDGAIIIADRGNTGWIIARDRGTFHVIPSVPGGELDESRAVGGLSSARVAAELIARLSA